VDQTTRSAKHPIPVVPLRRAAAEATPSQDAEEARPSTSLRAEALPSSEDVRKAGTRPPTEDVLRKAGARPPTEDVLRKAGARPPTEDVLRKAGAQPPAEDVLRKAGARPPAEDVLRKAGARPPTEDVLRKAGARPPTEDVREAEARPSSAVRAGSRPSTSTSNVWDPEANARASFVETTTIIPPPPVEYIPAADVARYYTLEKVG
jgi:hypothetical protein